MNITIVDNNPSQRQFEFNEILWTQHIKKITKFTIIHCLVGITFIILDIINFDGNSGELTIGHEKRQLNFHLGLGIGICYIYISLVNLRRQYTEKYKSITTLRETVVRHYNNSNTTVLTIANDLIKYESDVMKKEIKWTIITSYMLFDNYIFLLQDSAFSSSMTIDKTKISESEYNELISFLQKTKPETKKFSSPL